MTKHELLKSGERALSARDAARLYFLITGEDKTGYLMTRSDEVRKETAARYESARLKIKSGMPLELAAGRCFFYGEMFFVDDSTLIPRIDTETLIEAVQKYAGGDETRAILDLCTGTGCVGLTLARLYKNAAVTLSDVSPRALLLAEKNARALGLSERLEIKVQDLFRAGDFEPGRYDVITVNPPYIKAGAMLALDGSVKDYEPHPALDGGVDGLMFYRALFGNAAKSLKEGGLLFMEIGFDQKEEVETIVKDAGFIHLGTMFDLGGNPRVVAARKKGENKRHE